MGRRVVITGSAGHLGRALRAAFEVLGDTVVGIDKVTSATTDVVCDLDNESPSESRALLLLYDIIVCNANPISWELHHALAARAQQSIINISSIYALLGSDPRLYEGTEVEPTPTWYAAAKGALIALTRWQATTLAPVRSNAVCPGGIFRGHSPEFTQRYSSRVPLRRMATEGDIVPLVVFLASDDATYITGQVIAVDGGLSCW